MIFCNPSGIRGESLTRVSTPCRCALLLRHLPIVEQIAQHGEACALQLFSPLPRAPFINFKSSGGSCCLCFVAANAGGWSARVYQRLSCSCSVSVPLMRPQLACALLLPAFLLSLTQGLDAGGAWDLSPVLLRGADDVVVNM
jgi:hypothetical protein